MNNKSIYVFILLISMLVSCAKSTGIFPLIELSTSEANVAFPNPISLTVDQANSQIVLLNSNVDVLYDQGSIAVLSLDASDTASPVMTAQDIISVPNFAGEVYYDGAGSLYVPFREDYPSDDSLDTLKKFTLSASDISDALTGSVATGAFGISGSAGLVYVVADETLEIYDSTLTKTASVDLTTATTAGITDADARNVLSIAIDTTTNLAVVSNSGGKMFIIDLATNTIRQTVDGPVSTRNIIIDSKSRLYALDALTESVWIFDLNNLPAPASTPENVDDSKFLIASVGVGNTPYGIALDEANNRLYTGNYDDDSVSVIDTLSFQEINRVFLDQKDISSSFLRDCDGPFALDTGTFNSVSYVFVACFLSHDIVTINTQSLQVVEVYPNTAR